MADRKLKKSQSIIDFAIALIAVAALAVGIVRIWVWFNANYAKRQVGYQQSRLLAAGPNRPIDDYNAPTGIGADDAHREQGFQPIDLTEDWVFKGQASGTVGGGPVPFISAGLDCASQAKLLVDACTQQIISICGPDEDCDSCTLSDCDTEAGCGQACSLRKTAQTMRDTVEDLKERPFIWFFGGKKASKQLTASAVKIDGESKELEDTAKLVSQKIGALSDCCSKTTPELQNECIAQLQKEISDLWSGLSGDVVPPGEEPPETCPEGQAYLCYNETTQSLCAEGDEGCTCGCRSGTVPGCYYECSGNACVWVCPPGGTCETGCNTADGYEPVTQPDGSCICSRTNQYCYSKCNYLSGNELDACITACMGGS